MYNLLNKFFNFVSVSFTRELKFIFSISTSGFDPNPTESKRTKRICKFIFIRRKVEYLGNSRRNLFNFTEKRFPVFHYFIFLFPFFCCFFVDDMLGFDLSVDGNDLKIFAILWHTISGCTQNYWWKQWLTNRSSGKISLKNIFRKSKKICV